MTLLQILVFALIHGLTEFLPVSATAHLMMIPLVTQWPPTDLELDIAVRIGTLAAVGLYLWRDIGGMTAGLFRVLKGKGDRRARLFWQLVTATVPVIAAGVALKLWMPLDDLRNLVAVGWCTLGFGLLLWVVDRLCLTVKRLEHLTFLDSLVIGVAQAIAFLPGASRVGLAITTARMYGYERRDAARLAMLLSVPTIIGTTMLVGYELWLRQGFHFGNSSLIAMGLAFAISFLMIAFLMSWLRRRSFGPFVLYRCIIGLILLGFGYGVFQF